MGGERGSTARQRLAGKICCFCKAFLPDDPDHVGGERFCSRCIEQRHPKKRVYLNFMLRNSWHCVFLEDDLKTSLPRAFTFATADKIIELIKRGGGLKDLASRQAIEKAIQNGHGGVFLFLTREQYEKLTRGR